MRRSSKTENLLCEPCKKCGTPRPRMIRYGREGVRLTCWLCGYGTKLKATEEEAVKAWNQRKKVKEDKAMGIAGIIVEIRAEKVNAGPGNFARIAEAKVVNGTDAPVFVTVQVYDGTEYTASEQSVLDFMTGRTEEPADIIAGYTNAKEARASEYGAVFEKLMKAIWLLGEK